MKTPLNVYFLCETYTGYRNYFMRKAPTPQGLPPLYHTWNGYAERGDRVHIFTQDYMYDGYDVWRDESKQIHNVPVPGRALRSGRYSPWGKIQFRFGRLIGLQRTWRRALETAREEPPDILYSCSPYCTILGLRLARRFNAVHVVRRFGTTLYPVIQGKDRFGWRDTWHVEAWAYRWSFDMLVMGNDGTYGDKVALHFGCPPEKLRFWTNGINKCLPEPQFDRAAFRKELGYSNTQPLLLVLSRLAGWKRIDRTLELMRRLKPVRPDARLVIVGEGESEQTLKQLAATLGVADVCRFVGPVEHRQVARYLNGCDIYLQFFDLTNRCNPLYEAMTCGRPVVTLEDASIDDVVTHDVNALRVPPDDADAAAAAVLRILADPDLAERLGTAARRHILESFQSWPERIAMEVDAVYELVRKKRASA